MKIEKWIIQEPASKHKGEPQGCIIALPGRAIPGSMMEKFLWHTHLERSLQVVLEPENLEWYPFPNGPDNQRRATLGQYQALDVLEKAVTKIEKGWGFKRNQIALVGFSAGAVMSIWLQAHTDEPYAGVLSLAGAILDPKLLPQSKSQTPILLQHNMDDDCFKWDERYIPMKTALENKKYNVSSHECAFGGHNLTHDEVSLTRTFMSNLFGYAKDFEEVKEEEQEG